MTNCPYCNTYIDEKYNFCLECERQVKCLHCGNYLLRDKSKCLVCGTVLVSSVNGHSQMNTFSLEENQSKTSRSRKINLAFTDNAIDKVAPILSGHVPFASPIITSSVTNDWSSSPSIQQIDVAALPVIGSTEVIGEGYEALQETPHQNHITGTTAAVYFEQDSRGYLISKTPDYKGKSKRDQQIRFSVLYVWAYNEIHNEPVPNREHITQAAKDNGVYDTNYPSCLTQITKKYFLIIDGSYKLNPSGHVQLTQIQKDMTNADISGFSYWSTSSKSSSRGTRIKNEDVQEIEDWLAKPTKLSGFDVRALSSGVDLAMFALYDITKELKVRSSVSPSLAYEYLVKRYETVPVTKNAFGKSLTHKRNNKYFNKTSSGAYFLTTEGEQRIESLLN